MELIEILKTPHELRDLQWENNFFQAFSEAKVSLLSMEPITGPDGWPYMVVEHRADSQEPTQKLLHWLETRGIGLVLNPQAEYPDYLFSYGMIWYFRKTGLFYQQQVERPEGKVELNTADIKSSGEPTKDYLPDHVRSIIREFFRDQGILLPKILMLSTDDKNYDLAFSLESLGNPPEHEHKGIAEAITWFLPPHYSLMLISEKSLPSFVRL